MNEGGLHFEKDSNVFKALRKIAERLNGLGIDYAVVGGLALFQHGFRRFTEDVDILVTPNDLKTIHEKLEGAGYLPPFQNSKHLRDTVNGVKIEFLTTGDFPGDGRKKPVSFPDPSQSNFEADGIRYLNLHKLVELKLASGISSPHRGKDLIDVQELIKILKLPVSFATELNPSVRSKFEELWKLARKRYVTLWRNKWQTAEAKSLEDMISMLRGAADGLEEMRKDGVVLDGDTGVGEDYAHLITNDEAVAQKYGMTNEAEFWGIEDEDGNAKAPE